MESIFKELKEKIENYEKIVGVNSVELDNSEVSKIEEEIKVLKSKMDDLNTSMDGKSKIEKMNYYYEQADVYQSQGTQWALKKPITFFGNYDEDKADDYMESMKYCHNEAQKYRKMATDENEKAIPLEKEQEKLKIKREAIEGKLKVIDEMVNEMIKEVIKEEIIKREIKIPNFVPVTKYFNAPDEAEE